MQGIPEPSAQFNAKKSKILQQLAVPQGEYTDLSPKGSVDEGVRTLIDDINAHPGLVTTSSCAGRVSVFLEGRRRTTAEAADAGDVAAAPAQLAGVGGKGGGGKWLFVSHDPVPLGGVSGAARDGNVDDARREEDWAVFFGLKEGDHGASGVSDAIAHARGRLIHFKFEPMVGFAIGPARPPMTAGECTGVPDMTDTGRSFTSSPPLWKTPSFCCVADSKLVSGRVVPSTSSVPARSRSCPWSPFGPWGLGSSLLLGSRSTVDGRVPCRTNISRPRQSWPTRDLTRIRREWRDSGRL